MTTLWLYLLNVLVIAFPLAIFEIWLEKYKSGWGGEFYHPFWGKKIRIGLLLRIAEKIYVTPYHLIMFGVVIPGIFTAEYFSLRYLAWHGGWILSFTDISIVPAIFLPAVWLGVTVVEDFLWFALNWRYPDALLRLCRGEMAWHTRWVKITDSVKLPRFYLTVPLGIAFLFAVHHCIVRLNR
jgi:hypothetical protein